MRGYIVSFDVDICFEVLAAEGMQEVGLFGDIQNGSYGIFVFTAVYKM